jgi:hypothetical protein
MATTNPITGSLIACLLKLAQGERVNAHQRQSRQPQRHECDVEHDRLLVGSVLSANPRKLSISNWAAARKDFVSFSGTVRWLAVKIDAGVVAWSSRGPWRMPAGREPKGAPSLVPFYRCALMKSWACDPV